jgi:hypothetical protein
MTRKLKTLVLVAIFAIIGMYQSNAQTDFSIHVGYTLPQGNFGKSNMNKNKVAWNGDTDWAGAGSGLNAGVKFRFNVPSVKGLGIIATADFFYNGPNDDVKYWKEEQIADLNETYWVDDYELEIPKYFNIPIMLGANYQYEIGDKLKLWGEFAIGINFGEITNMTLSATGSMPIYDDYTGAYYGEIDCEYTGEAEFMSSDNSSFAYQLGAGVMLSDKISLGLHYYVLGKQRVQGYLHSYQELDGRHIDESLYEETSSSEEIRGESINPTMLTFRLGFHF